MPRGPVALVLLDDPRFAQALLELDEVAAALLLERADQARGVRNDDDLHAPGGARDQAPERGQQVGMKAGFGLVQDQQARRPRREQRRYPQYVAQGSVGELRRFQRTQQSVLAHLELEAAVGM